MSYWGGSPLKMHRVLVYYLPREPICKYFTEILVMRVWNIWALQLERTLWFCIKVVLWGPRWCMNHSTRAAPPASSSALYDANYPREQFGLSLHPGSHSVPFKCSISCVSDQTHCATGMHLQPWVEQSSTCLTVSEVSSDASDASPADTGKYLLPPLIMVAMPVWGWLCWVFFFKWKRR